MCDNKKMERKYFMNDEVQISFIVTIYNKELFIKQCIESILSQNMGNWELILVDDGSVDGSVSICKQFINDDRIKLIQQKNSGVVCARKTGVAAAVGRYIIFVDADDWVSSCMLEKIKPWLNQNIDVINFEMTGIGKKSEFLREYTVNEGIYEGDALKDLYKKMMFDFEKSEPGIIQSLCTKAIKRELLQFLINNTDERLTLGEDAAVVYPVLLNANRVLVLKQSLYFYRIVENSMVRSWNLETFKQIYIFRMYMLQVYEVYSESFRLDVQLQAYLLHFLLPTISSVYGIPLCQSYKMPFKTEEIGDRIVLYGAGKVGQAYHKQLIMKNIEVVAWLDTNLHGEKIGEYSIENIDVLDRLSYDGVLVAVKSKENALAIMKSLQGIVPKEKILWKKPVENWNEIEVQINE